MVGLINVRNGNRKITSSFDLTFDNAQVVDVKRETITSKKDPSKSWEKSTVVIYHAEILDGYEVEKYIPVTFFGKNAEKAKNIKIGDRVDVKAELGGRRWAKEGNEFGYFLEVSGWYCRKSEGSLEIEDRPIAEEEDEDLPF